jgi:hypothetical protein
MVKKIIIIGVIAVVAIFLLIQLVPYGKDHSNPPVVQEPNWDSPQTRELAVRACFDCHSNETVWPWYSKIAPISWLVYKDTIDGRRRLNFSDWGNRRPGSETGEVSGIVLEGEMPPIYYLPTHPAARLTDAEKQALAQGLANSVGGR